MLALLTGLKEMLCAGATTCQWRCEVALNAGRMPRAVGRALVSTRSILWGVDRRLPPKPASAAQCVLIGPGGGLTQRCCAKTSSKLLGRFSCGLQLAACSYWQGDETMMYGCITSDTHG